MTYPITVLLNKTADDILNYTENIAKERNIQMDLLPFVLDHVTNRIKDKAIGTLSNMNIEAFNTIDNLSKQIPEESEKVEGEVVE